MGNQPVREVLGVDEVNSLRFLKACIAEFLGTAMLVLIGCGSVATLFPGARAPIITVAFAFGFGLAMVIWVIGHISGAHVNPSISIAFLVTGHISVLKCLFYIVSQVVGAILGAAIVWYSIPVDWRDTIGSPALVEGLEVWQGVLVEAIGTFFLVMTVFASCDRLRTDHSGSIALAIGFCLTAQITWAGTLTGCSINPARALGPAIWSSTWDDHWVFWTAPIGGGIIAAFFYEHVFAEQNRETQDELRGFKYNNYGDGYRIKKNKTGFLDYTIEIEAPPVSEEKPEYTNDVYNMDMVIFPSNQGIDLEDTSTQMNHVHAGKSLTYSSNTDGDSSSSYGSGHHNMYHDGSYRLHDDGRLIVARM